MTASALAPRFGAALDALTAPGKPPLPSGAGAKAGEKKARENAQDFEAMFLNSMFQHMMTGIEGDGPFGGSTGVGVWRSFLTGEYAKAIARKGGIGIADQVYGALVAQQAAQSAQSGAAPGAAQKR